MAQSALDENSSWLNQHQAKPDRQLYRPCSWKRMHISSFSGGTCLNVQNIIEYQFALDLADKRWQVRSNLALYGCPYRITEFFSTEETKRAFYISEKYNIRHTIIDNVESGEDRWAYDRKMARILGRRAVDFFFFGGTAEHISRPFIHTFAGRIIGVNLGNLHLRDQDGDYKFFGSKSVLKTILNGQTESCVTIFLLGVNHRPQGIIQISDPTALLGLDTIAGYEFEKNAGKTAGELDELAAYYDKHRADHAELFHVVQTNVTHIIRYLAHFTLARTLLDLSLGHYFQNKAGIIYRERKRYEN